MAKCVTTLGQVDIWSDLWVRMTFFQTLGQADLLSDVPPNRRHLVAKFVTTLGQVDICSDFPLVRCTPNRNILWPSVLLL